MATKWSCMNHHSDDSQKELSHTRHAVLNYLPEDFLQIPLQWLKHRQKLKPGLGEIIHPTHHSHSWVSFESAC